MYIYFAVFGCSKWDSVDRPPQKSGLPDDGVGRGGLRLPPAAAPPIAHFGPEILNERRSVSTSWKEMTISLRVDTGKEPK